MPNFTSIDQAFDYIVEQIADLKGEVLAARTLAAFALHAELGRHPNATEWIEEVALGVDNALKGVTLHGPGEPDLEAKIVEIARLRTDETLSALRRSVVAESGKRSSRRNKRD